MTLLRANRKRQAVLLAADRARPRRQHDVRRDFAHRAGDDADHAGGICAAASAAAEPSLSALCVAAVLAAVAWNVSPQLRTTVAKFVHRLPAHRGSRTMTAGIGSRLDLLGEVAEVLRRGAGDRPRHRIDARPVRAGRDRRDRRAGPDRRESAQPDAERRGAVGRGRRRSVLYAMWLAHLLLFRGEGLGELDRAIWWWCRISSPRCSIRICSISTRAGSMCWASASPAA